MNTTRYIIAKIHVLPLLAARRGHAERAESSLDLNLTRVELPINDAGALLPNGYVLTWSAMETIAKKDGNCFLIEQEQPEPVTRFSARFNRAYTLRATDAAPTMLISGIPMHRIKGITPDIDTDHKIAAVGRIYGRVLDTATGLGYTAIRAAEKGAAVVTIELDPTVLEIGRCNPWSRALFDNPNIEQRIGSSAEVIREMRDAEFDIVLHDPPTISLGGELYSLDFYSHVFRVLRRGGTFFHYIGDLESRSGASVAKGAARRMQEAGFKKIVRHQDAFALVATR